MQPKQASMYDFMTRIEKVLINDEVFMRLLKYQPQGWDFENDVEILDPLDTRLPNVVDGSKEYWDLVKDKFRKGLKRTDIEQDATVLVYMYEGRRRPIFGNYLLATQEVVFSIFIHELYESDYRISRISDRLSYLLANEHISGFGKMEYVSGNPREAPIGFRRYDVTYLFNVNEKANA